MTKNKFFLTGIIMPEMLGYEKDNPANIEEDVFGNALAFPVMKDLESLAPTTCPKSLENLSDLKIGDWALPTPTISEPINVKNGSKEGDTYDLSFSIKKPRMLNFKEDVLGNALVLPVMEDLEYWAPIISIKSLENLMDLIGSVKFDSHIRDRVFPTPTISEPINVKNGNEEQERDEFEKAIYEYRCNPTIH